MGSELKLTRLQIIDLRFHEALSKLSRGRHQQLKLISPNPFAAKPRGHSTASDWQHKTTQTSLESEMTSKTSLQ